MASIMKIMVPIVAYAMIIVPFASYCTEASIGMNWGRESAQRLVPSQVVDLLLQNGIGRARIYTTQPDILMAFRGSGINITATILRPSALQSMETAREWVRARKDYILHSNVKYIVFGEYVFFKALTDKTYLSSAFNALRLLQTALNEQSFSHVKVTFLNFEMQMKMNVTKPSECEFLDAIKPEMVEYTRFLREFDAPFWVEHVPLTENDHLGFDPEFAFPDNTRFVVNDGGVVYSNIVEWRYDCNLWALRKLNASDLKVSFSMVGWPTDGYPGATAANAERFFKHLLPWVTSNKGTPLQPGMPIDVNIHALADETKIIANPPFIRHWGIYRSNGEPKYKIDLTGQGRDVYPNTIKGIMRMPSRWCVFNGNHQNMDKVKAELESACKVSDCTSTLPGGSCSGLSFEQNVSYALNMRFQFQFQDEAACNATSFGRVVVENPSTDVCVFPVEVVKGQQVNYVSPSQFNGVGFCRTRPRFALTVVWLAVLLLV